MRNTLLGTAALAASLAFWIPAAAAGEGGIAPNPPPFENVRFQRRLSLFARLGVGLVGIGPRPFG